MQRFELPDEARRGESDQLTSWSALGQMVAVSVPDPVPGNVDGNDPTASPTVSCASCRHSRRAGRTNSDSFSSCPMSPCPMSRCPSQMCHVYDVRCPMPSWHVHRSRQLTQRAAAFAACSLWQQHCPDMLHFRPYFISARRIFFFFLNKYVCIRLRIVHITYRMDPCTHGLLMIPHWGYMHALLCSALRIVEKIIRLPVA